MLPYHRYLFGAGLAFGGLLVLSVSEGGLLVHLFQVLISIAALVCMLLAVTRLPNRPTRM